MTTPPPSPPVPGPVTRLPSSERRVAIVEAVLVVAAGRSPARITTGEIAAVLGLTQGALFKHFPSKESIWVAVIEWVHARLIPRLEAAMVDAAPSPLASLRAMFAAHVNFVTEHPGVPRVIFHELQQPGDSPVKQAVRRLLQQYRQLLLGCLAKAVSTGEAAAGLNLDAAATLFIGLVQGLVMQSLINGTSRETPAPADQVFELFLQALRGKT